MIKGLLVALAFAGGVLAFYIFSALNSGDYAELVVEENCDFNRAGLCGAVGRAGQRLSLQLSPRPLPLLKDIEIKLRMTGIDQVNTTQLALEGINMYMGLQIIPLQQDKQQPDLYTGVMQLPVCSSQTMQWMVTAYLNTSTQKYKASFPFITTTP